MNQSASEHESAIFVDKVLGEATAALLKLQRDDGRHQDRRSAQATRDRRGNGMNIRPVPVDSQDGAPPRVVDLQDRLRRAIEER